MKKTIKTDYKKECTARLLTVKDALDVVSGKWKILIIMSIMSGNKRFSEIEKSIPKISSKVLAKELKGLEEDQLIKRTVYDSFPVLIEYTPTDHVFTLGNVIEALHNWGLNHRKRILGQ